MKIAGFILTLILLHITAPAQADDLDSSGYMPLPDVFIGEWVGASTISRGEKFSIAQTPTGGILTEHNTVPKVDEKLVTVTRTITFKVFSIDNDTAIAIGKWQSSRQDDHKPTHPPIYHYYKFVHSPSESDKSIMHLTEFRAMPSLTEQALTAPISFHQNNTRNECKKPNIPSPCIWLSTFSAYSHFPQWK